MKFLLDTDTCSALMRRPSLLSHRFIQYGVDNIAISTITLAELVAGAFKSRAPQSYLRSIDELRRESPVLTFDLSAAEFYGRNKGSLARRGIVVPAMDLLIAAVALAHDLTLVTHNTADFQAIPDLRLDDWLAM